MTKQYQHPLSPDTHSWRYEHPLSPGNRAFGAVLRNALYADTSRGLKAARKIDAIDIDAGRVDPELVGDIRKMEADLEWFHQTDQPDNLEDALRREALHGPRMVDIASLERRFGIGKSREMESKYALMIYGESHTGFDFFNIHDQLGKALNNTEKAIVFPVVRDLINRSRDVGKLFPAELQEGAMYSYGESVANILYVLNALKRGHKLPRELPLGKSGKVEIGEYDFDHAVETIISTDEAVGRIIKSTGRCQPVERVAIPNPDRTLNTGLYRFGEQGDVLATVRLLATAKRDNDIEYGNRNGTQASISYVTQEYGGFVPERIKEQKSSFSIRIDNEDDKLGFDIGSILGKKGSLGKRIADLIAIGDALRTREGNGKEPALNHNSSKFIGSGLEERELFAGIAADKLAEFEARATATEISRLGLGQRAGA